jgi:predicted HicB family RNase H-like nuclease
MCYHGFHAWIGCGEWFEGFEVQVNNLSFGAVFHFR